MPENNNDINNIDNIENIEPEVIEETEMTEETAQQPEIFEKSKEKNGKTSDSMIKTAAVLGVLALMTALTLSVLNMFTAPIIEERLGKEKDESVKDLFGGNIITQKIDGYEDLYKNYGAEILEVLAVYNEQEIAGYCVKVSPKGYSGNIDMLVAVDSEGIIIDTAILSMSETAGLGTKIDDESFKGQFKNKSGNIRANEVNDANSIDTIANATVSSRAFLNGVNAALAVLYDILSGGGE